MRQLYYFILLAVSIFQPLKSQSLNFSRTLRADFIFSGTVEKQYISIEELSTFNGWAGRRGHLNEVPLRGNGQLCLQDARTKKVLYRHSFSTLFQEWLTTEEAKRVNKAFQNVFLMPMPTDSALLSIELYDTHSKVVSSFSMTIHPRDILIRSLDGLQVAPHKYLWKAGVPDKKIDIAIVAEGYTEAEQNNFYSDAIIAMESLFSHEPFKSRKDCFNIVAVALPSQNSGISIPKRGLWKQTALSSHFDTFYSDRYLTTLNLRKLNDALQGIPYEHIIILANTDNYGGGGIYNSYTLTTAKHSAFRPVVVHEFGHSFGGLADEYYNDTQFSDTYNAATEPWESNITTHPDDSKWKDVRGAKMYEGAGCQAKNVYRGFENCRMKTNEYPEFCRVCQRALNQLIDFYTK